jgi:mucin-19
MAHLPTVTLPGFLRRLLLSTSALLPAAMGVAQAQAPNAVPTGGQVSAGQATITQSGNRTQVTQGSNRAVVDWQRFDVGRNSSVNFTQPNAQSWTLNRVQTPDPSMIAGRITANGGVAIVNQSGVVFTPGSQVNVGSLIASTANITNQNFMAGRMVFDGASREGARVENHGSITVADRGLAALVGPGVTNTGTIRARLGTAVVAGAETFRLDLAGDGMLSLEVTESVRRTANGNAALVTNSGVIEAQGGQVILSAHAASGLVESVVRNTGRVAGRQVAVTGQGGNVDIAAGSVTTRGGSVSITAPDAAVRVGPQARVSASSRTGGGQVQLGGATTSAVRVEGRVSSRGTGANATGGRVAVQARDSVTVAPTAVVNASGTAGGGTVLLGTTGVGRAQTMARETRVESGAVVRADAVTSGSGGTIVVNSTENTVMSGTLSARGGSLSGDGGFVEVSGLNRLSLDLSKVDARAPMGRAGTLLIDPDSIIIAATGTNVGGDVNAEGAPVGGVLTLSADSIRTFAGGALVLEAVFSVTVNAAIDTTIVASAGPPPVAASTLTNLTLRTTNALGDGITIGAGVTLNAGNLTLTSASGITLNQAVSANNVNLNAAGAIAGAGVVTTAGTLTVRGATGGATTSAVSLSLPGANQVATLDARTTNALFFANERGAGLTVAQARSADSSVTIAANGLISNPNGVSPTGGISATNGFVLLRPFDTASPTTNTAFEIANAAPAGGITVGHLANIATPRLSLRSTGNAALTVATSFTSPSAALELVGNSITVNALANVSASSAVTLIADTLSLGARIQAPGGTVTIMPLTQGRNVTLGGTAAGTLSLTPADLLLIGGGGADGLTNPATMLRIGRADPTLNTVGNIVIAAPAVAGTISVDLGTRVGALELFANTATGTITTQTVAPDRVGAINVASLAGIAGGAITLDGPNRVTTLAGITDGAPYVIAAPFTDAGGTIVGLSVQNTSLWAGAGNAQAGGPVASGLTFNNAGNVGVEGSVLNSGVGNLALTTTAGSNGNITVNPTRWVATENGTITVTAGGTGVLDNSGTIVSGSLSGGSVTSGGAGFNRATGTIALGTDPAPPAPAVTSEIINIQTNEAGGFLFAKTITNLNSNSGLILTGNVGSGTLGTTTIGGLTSGGAVNNTGTIVGNVQVLSLINSGTILGDTVVATGGNIDNSGRILTHAMRASGNVTNSGDIIAGTGSASVNFTVDAAIVRVGAITPGSAPTPIITTTESLGGNLSIQAGGSIIQTGGTITAGNAATDGATVRGITLTAGTSGYGNNDIIQTGGVIRRTDDTVGNLQLAASAGREIRLNQSGNTFNEIIGWQAQEFAGPPALAATAVALPALTSAPVMSSYGIAAGGDVTLQTSATTLTTNANIRAGGGTATVQRNVDNTADVSVTGRGTTLTIRANNLEIDPAIAGIRVADRTGAGAPGANATPSTLLLTRNTAGGVLVVGAPTAGEITTGALALSVLEVTQLFGPRVQFGEATGSTLSAIRIGANADFRTGTARANELRLVTTGDATQDNNTAINVERLSGNASGSISLGSRVTATGLALNTFDVVSDLSAGGSILLTRLGVTALRVEDDIRGPNGVQASGTGLQVGVGQSLTLLADDLAISRIGTIPGPVARDFLIEAPNGFIRIGPVTVDRNVTLGGAGGLSLTGAELALIGGDAAAAVSAPNRSAAMLRIGNVVPMPGTIGSNATNAVGNITIGADGVNLDGRVAGLELFANGKSGTIIGSGVINVASLAGIAGGAITLDGPNRVTTLAGITDGAPYVIAAPFTDAGGTIVGLSVQNTSLWAGAGNAQAGGPVASGLTFNNAGNVGVEGSVLNSGVGNLALTTTAGSNGNITVNPTRWVATENGTITVTAGGTGVLDNSGTIVSGSLSGGSVTSGGAGFNRATGTIALGTDPAPPAPAVTSEIINIQTNEAGGFLFAKTITNLNSNSGLILTGNVGSGTLGTTTIGGLTSGGAVNNTGTIVGNVQVLSLINSGTILGDTVVATGGNIDNSGRILTHAMRASGNVTNSGDIIAGTGSASVNFTVDAAIVRVGAITPGSAPTPIITTTESLGGNLSIQAGGSIIQTGGTITAGNAATDGATVRGITLTAGTSGYGNNDIIQTGGVIRRTDDTVGNLQLAASAGREIRLNQSGNTFNEIIGWQAQEFAGPPALAATAVALPALTSAPVMSSYGIAAGGDVTLQTSATTLTVNAGIRAGGGNHTTQRHPTDITLADVPVTPTSLSIRLGAANALLTVNAPLRSEQGSAGPSLLTLQADRMAINQVPALPEPQSSMTLIAPGGTIRLRTESAGHAINLGGDATDPAGSLDLGADELTRIGGLGADGLTTPAARLRIGANNAGAITVTGNVILRNGAADVDGAFQSRVNTLELVSATSVTQNAGTSISVEGIAGRAGASGSAGGDFRLVDQSTRGTASVNAIDRIVAGTLDGTPTTSGAARNDLTAFAGTSPASGHVEITTRRNLTVEAPVVADRDATLRVAPDPGTNGLLTAAASISVGTGRLLTLQADRMALNAVDGSMTLVAPNGTVRLRTESAGRAINLGGISMDVLGPPEILADPAGSLNLGADELTRIGGLGADGLTTPAARLRIGDDAGGAITVTGDVILRNDAAGVDGAFQSRVTTLELVSASNVTQDATTSISVQGIAGQAGSGEFTLHDRATHDVASLNAIDRIVAGTLDGTLIANGAARNELTAGTDIAITTRRNLTVGNLDPLLAAPVIAGQDAILRVAPATDTGVLTVNSAISVGNGLAMTLVADSMAIAANLIAPNGSIRVMPFTAGRNVTLGGEVEGTLSLSNTELAFFGTGGTAATVLRIGRVSPAADAGALYTALNANTVGNINVAGAVDLRTRLTALELFANSQSGSISGAGAINVASLAGIAGGAISLTGANTVDTLARVTDAGTVPNTAPAYVIAAPFLDNAGAILTRSIGNTALWAGAGNAQAGGPVASGLTFNNAGNLTVDGTVLNSGAGNLALTTTAGSNGNITVNATRWIAAENGTITVTAGGTGVLDNSGTIVSASRSGGSVTSGGVGINRAGAVIALGSPAGTSSISGIATNSGLLYAKDVSGLTTNSGTGRVWTERDGLPGTNGTIGMTADATNAGILVGAVTGAGAFTNQPNAWVVGSLSATSVTNDPTGRIAVSFVRATGTDIVNNGTINAAEITAARDVINNPNAIIQAGGGSATFALTIPATSNGDVNAARVREGAIRGLIPEFSITPSASLADTLTIGAGHDITNSANGLVTATARLNLHADGAISGAGRVVMPLLVVRGATGAETRAGSFDMTAATNAVEVLDARSNRLQAAASERLVFGQTAGFRVTQANAGNGNITLHADGAITRSAGATTGVVGDLLTVRGAPGGTSRAASLDLTEGGVTTGNAIQRLDARTNLLGAANATPLTYGQAAGFSVTQADVGAGNLALRSDGAITRTAGVTTGVVANTLTLRGAAGGTAGAGSVSLVDGSVTTGNAITNLDASTNNGALTFGQAGAIILTQLDTGTGNATLRSDGAISNTGLVNTALLTVRGAAGGSTAANSLTLTGANTIGGLDILVRGTVALTLASGTTIQQLGSSAGSVDVTANGTLAVAGATSATQDMTLRATTGNVGILPGGAVSSGRATTLTAAGDVLQTGGSLSAGTALTITAGQDAIQTGGSTSAASLGTATQGVSAGRDFLWNGGNVTLPTVNAVTAGRDLSLRTTGGATTVLGTLSAGRNLAVETTAGALTLQGNTVRASAGTLGLRAAGDMGVFSANLSAGQAMTLRATGRLTSNPSSFTAESISLVSGAGLSFTQATLTARQNLTAEAGAEITFQNSTLRASTALADNQGAFRVLRLSAAGSLALRNSNVTADRAELVAGGAMTTAGSSFAVGTGLLLSARGGVGQANEAPTAVTPLDNSRLPLVIYDTRSGIFLDRLPDLLTTNTTDQPSRAFNAQTWQVPQVNAASGQLFFGVNDGAVTPPTNAAAGAIQINLNAGTSPVFMLLNGGTASGNITAGRMGVYGLPGSATLPDGRALNLNGSLGGVGGEGAARFGILGGAPGSQPSPLALDLYRFNNCVISSVNCVVPTFLQLPTIPLINSVILGIQQPGFDDRDVLLPNVAEKDF